MGLTRQIASTTHPAQPRESERFGNPLAAPAAVINALLLPEPPKANTSGLRLVNRKGA